MSGLSAPVDQRPFAGSTSRAARMAPVEAYAVRSRQARIRACAVWAAVAIPFVLAGRYTWQINESLKPAAPDLVMIRGRLLQVTPVLQRALAIGQTPAALVAAGWAPLVPGVRVTLTIDHDDILRLTVQEAVVRGAGCFRLLQAGAHPGQIRCAKASASSDAVRRTPLPR
jgi:hypothetical protein